MSVSTLLVACAAIVGIGMAGSAAAQSYLQSGDLSSIRQSNQATPGSQLGVMLVPPAPRPDNTSGVSAQFSKGMEEGERLAQRQRETSAMNDMQMKTLTDAQRAPQGRYSGAPVNADGAIYFGEQGQTACRKDPVSGRVQCGAMPGR